jgi:hypothetical protein
MSVPKIEAIQAVSRTTAIQKQEPQHHHDSKPSSIIEFPELGKVKKNYTLPLPMYCAKQCELHEKALDQILLDFKEFEELRQKGELDRLHTMIAELKELDERDRTIKQDVLFRSLVSALSACTAFLSGAIIMITSGNIYAGGALMLGAITSVAAQASSLHNSPYTEHLHMLSLGISLFTLSAGGAAGQQCELLKQISSLTIVCKSLLGMKKGFDNNKRVKLEKDLFLMKEESRRFSLSMKKLFAITGDIIEKVNAHIEYCVELAASQTKLMTEVSKKQEKRG